MAFEKFADNVKNSVKYPFNAVWTDSSFSLKLSNDTTKRIKNELLGLSENFEREGEKVKVLTSEGREYIDSIPCNDRPQGEELIVPFQ